MRHELQTRHRKGRLRNSDRPRGTETGNLVGKEDGAICEGAGSFSSSGERHTTSKDDVTLSPGYSACTARGAPAEALMQMLNNRVQLDQGIINCKIRQRRKSTLLGKLPCRSSLQRCVSVERRSCVVPHELRITTCSCPQHCAAAVIRV